jgi:sensor histidine kinase YesM
MIKKLFRNIHFQFLLASITIDFCLFYVFIYINTGELWPKQITFSFYITENWPVLLQFYLVLHIVYYTLRYFNKKYRYNPNSLSRFIRELLFISIVGFLMQQATGWAVFKFAVSAEGDDRLEVKLRMLQMVNMAFILIIYAIFTSMRIFRFLQQQQLNVLRWQKEYAQSQFEVLKNQLNPHFLFNSLSVLTSLVYIDPDRSETFIEKLSKTYRYLLEQKDKETVPLKKEMEFLEGYQYLVKQRFGAKIHFHIQVYEQVLSRSILPHVMMITLEYIVANNAMSAAKPLNIHIYVEADRLIVRYCCQPKAQIEKTSERQLIHLQERYQFLVAGRSMQILEQGEWNSIHYPLLP